MEEFVKTGRVEISARRADMDRKTARRYLAAGELPSAMEKDRSWRTREDPFAADWSAVTELLAAHSGIQALTVFEELKRRHPGRYQDGQLRTLQRRIRQWRALSGPAKEVFFEQEHRPGEAMQTDFTWANELGVTVQGEPLVHMLCHSVLPFSNWESVTVSASESMEALKRGVQKAFVRLGRVTRFHQTDHSTAATHNLGGEKGRGFNKDYEGFCEHFCVEPRTTAIGEKEQNGDVESSHRALKRRLEQRLLLRGSRDFESVSAYEAWIDAVTQEANGARTERLAIELGVMRPLPLGRFPEYREVEVKVSSGSTIRVKRNTYSVPSRLIGEMVTVRLFDMRVEVVFAGKKQLEFERLRGENGHRINYRHIIHWLVRKPGAFERYRYREDLFPTLVFRRAFDRLLETRSAREADRHYLALLLLAAKSMESLVERAIADVMERGEAPTHEAIAAIVEHEKPEVPEIAPIVVDLAAYDGLLEEAV